MGLYKRGKVWWIAYTVAAKTPDGIEFQDLKRQSTGCRKREDAEKVWINLKSAQFAGTYVPEADRRVEIPRPFEIVVTSYLEDREARGKRTDSYKKLHAWAEAFRGRDLASISIDDVERQLSTWATGKTWAGRTYNNAVAQLSGLFSWAYRKRWIDQHPLRGRVERMPVSAKRKIEWRRYHVEALLDAAPGEWLRDIILGACFTGLRRSAFLGLRVGDVERDDTGALWLYVGRDKNGEPVRKRFRGEIADVVDRRIRAAAGPTDYLFPGPEGKHAEKAVRRALHVVVERAAKTYPELSAVTFHGFRAAFATLLGNATKDLDTVKALGNWKTRKVLEDSYFEQHAERLRDAEDALGAILSFHNASHSTTGATSPLVN